MGRVSYAQLKSLGAVKNAGRVFLTDANYKHTLAAIRSLGQKGLKVDVGSASPLQIGAFSKYANLALVYPDPKISPERFVKFILKTCTRNKYDMIIPIGYTSTVTLSMFKEKLEHAVKIPVADYEQMRVAACKDETITLAKKLGIPTPNTIRLEENDINRAKTLRYPLVVKGITDSGRVYYVASPKELTEKSSLLFKVEGKSPLIQEYIRGEGFGFFALFNHGEPRAMFMHRRIREYPITGGPSTVAESVYEPKLREYGLKILDTLNWHGVAMVEFKRDAQDNEFKLMEINTKFWGSLDLAIASGVDFPYLLYRMAVEGDIKPVFSYKVGVRFMWPFPDDVFHVLANPSAFPAFAKNLADKSIKKNVMLSDLKPNVMQLFKTSILVLYRLRNYTQLRYPHGMPRG
jgi:predicted ATP-grasp superfamily ATP-dependent carboligase